jgi:putative inorganic carbon (HCO3(-)) transporter
MNKEKLLSLAETWSEFFLYGFILFTPLGNAGGEIFFGLIALCFVIRKMIRPDFNFLKKREYFWLLLFFVFCGLSLINSGPLLQKSVRALFLKWGKFILVFIFIREMLTSSVKLKRVAWVITGVAALIALDCLVQYFTGHDLFYGRPPIHGSGYLALTASFKNSNNLSSYLVPMTLVVLALAATAPTGRLRWILWTLTGGLGACLLLTFSRGAWIGFLCGLFLMAFLLRRWKVLLPVLALFVLAIGLNPLLAKRAVPVLFLAAGQQTAGFSERTELLKIGAELIRENPFLGKGLGTFMDYAGQRAVTAKADYAHNCYLQIWAESGIFSLLVFLLFAGTVLGKALKARKTNKDPLLLGLLCGIFAFLIHSAFDTQFYSLQQAFLFWSMFGILAAASDRSAG